MSARLILRGATLLDGKSPPRQGMTIAIRGETIESIDRVPPLLSAGDRVIDLAGRTVMPGMILCHYHATYHGVGGALPVGFDAPPALQTLRAAKNLELLLQSGFTGAVSAGAPFAIDTALKLGIAEGIIAGPRFVAGSRDVSTTGHAAQMQVQWWWGDVAPIAANICDGPDSFRRGVREEIRRGAEIIKLFASPGHLVPGNATLMDIAPDELAAASEAAHERGALIRAHVANKRAILAALDANIDLIDHGDGLDEECIARLLATDTPLVPSLLFPYDSAPHLPEPAAAEVRKAIAEMLAALRLAQRAGVRIVLGDDYGAFGLTHGRYAEELAYYVEQGGFAPLDVIKWATVNAAPLFGEGDRLGQLAPGNLADLLVIDGDPLADIAILQDRARLLAIMKGGRLFKDELGTLEVASAGARH